MIQPRTHRERKDRVGVKGHGENVSQLGYEDEVHGNRELGEGEMAVVILIGQNPEVKGKYIAFCARDTTCKATRQVDPVLTMVHRSLFRRDS